jgi:small neutral amino acid transporter SnatA (MarC family)
MNAGFLLLAFVAAVNPARARLGLTDDKTTPQARVGVLAIASLGCFAVSGSLTALGGETLDVLDISPESFRLAMGLVLSLEGAHRLLLPLRPGDDTLRSGSHPAVLPMVLGLLLTPGLVLLALGAGAEASTGEALGTLASAFVLVTLAGLVSYGSLSAPLLLVCCRLLGALEIAAGTALAVQGVQDV